MTVERKQAAARLTDDGFELLGKLRKKLGLSTTAIVELAIHRLADLEGVTVGPSTEEEKPRRG